MREVLCQECKSIILFKTDKKMACIIVDILLLVKTCQASISYPGCIVARTKIQGFRGIMIILNVYMLQ